ncbi:MAG: hypothetical protein ABEJ68_01165 [Halobacteriaceae archaeon]
MTRYTLSAGWREAAFERDSYGPSNTPGLAATFDHESLDDTVRVLPVRYGCTDGEESLTALTTDFAVEWRDPAAYTPDVPEQTVFAVVADCERLTPDFRRIATLTRDADDALAIATWLMDGADGGRDVARRVISHRGEQFAVTTDPALADDDVLATRLDDAPERCLLTGKPTRSHVVDVPYRYAATLPDVPTSARSVVRFPSRLDTLHAAFSHAAWTDRDLHDGAFDAPLERVSPGTYELGAAASVVADGAFERFALGRLGD